MKTKDLNEFNDSIERLLNVVEENSDKDLNGFMIAVTFNDHIYNHICGTQADMAHMILSLINGFFKEANPSVIMAFMDCIGDKIPEDKAEICATMAMNKVKKDLKERLGELFDE